ncbi:MAG TPA: methyltransferase domain-containing protein [Acidobacteriota bacterium]|nr:methyltransferase domain-containing protein [Acidobacteriota bacterium]
MYILFPGRHLVLTQFQEWYLRQVLVQDMQQVYVDGKKPKGAVLDTIIFTITSANFDSSRYSPVPLMFRIAAIQAFASQLEKEFNIKTHIIAVPHYPQNDRFARQIISEIHEQTEGEITITPKNTLVLTSTKEVGQQYKKLGYSILPAEASPDLQNAPQRQTPSNLIKIIAEANQKKPWYNITAVRNCLHPATRNLWMSAPWIVSRIKRLWTDPLLNDSGDLTSERDYQSYAIGMSNPAIMSIKYNELKPFIKEGKIADEGCADGALLSFIAKDFPDSDLLGVEITGAFYQRCLAAQQAGFFGKSFIHFHQRNILQPLFRENSIDTTLCNSTLHELWSYVKQESTLDSYLKLKFKQLKPGGILAARDVVGPKNGTKKVLLWCNKKNGSNSAPLKSFKSKKDLTTYLKKLSTHARFIRFAQDYLHDISKNRRSAPRIKYKIVTIKGTEYFQLTLKDATEFLTKMSYVDNWTSEMNEEFAFYDIDDWKRKLRKHGFQVVETKDGKPATRTYSSSWIKEHVWQDSVKLFEIKNNIVVPHEFPVTNMILVAQKPL